MSKRVFITLLQTCMIAGLPRSPIEGVQEIDEDEAERLIDAGMAELADIDAAEDGGNLNALSLKELRALADAEGVKFSSKTSQADLIAAIVAGRDRAALTTELDTLDKVQLVDRAKAEQVEVGEDADESTLRAAIIGKHFPAVE